MRTTHSAGGVVINKEGKILVVNQRGSSWSLPKGHIDPKEEQVHAAKREIYEETGIKNLVLIKKLGTYKRPKMESENIDSKEEMKVMTIFLFKTDYNKISPHDKNNPVAEWLDIEDVAKILTHPKDKAFFRKIKNSLNK